MFCWGKIAEGHIGLGEVIEDEPILVPKSMEDNFGALSQIKDIVCGWEYTAVVTNDVVICTCGRNDSERYSFGIYSS